MGRSATLFVCLFVHLSVCVFVNLPVCSTYPNTNQTNATFYFYLWWLFSFFNQQMVTILQTFLIYCRILMIKHLACPNQLVNTSSNINQTNKQTCNETDKHTTNNQVTLNALLLFHLVIQNGCCFSTPICFP